MEMLLSNNWCVALVIGVVLAIVVGAAQYKMSAADLRIRKRFSDRVFSLVGKIVGIIVAIMAAFESTDGILQLLDNNLGGVKDPTWSLILFPIAIAAIAAIVWAIVGIVGIVASRVKRSGLKCIRKDVIKKRRREKSVARCHRYTDASKKFTDFRAYKKARRA